MSTLRKRICQAAKDNKKEELGNLLQIVSEQDLCYEDDSASTALMWASRNGNTEMAEILFRAGSDVNHPSTRHGWTALMYASKWGTTATAQALIQWGANLDLVDTYGMCTALMYAAEEGHLETVQVLLVAGANRTLRDNSGKTAADLASNKKIKKLIDNYGADPTPFRLSSWFGLSKKKKANNAAQKPAATATAAADPLPPCPATIAVPTPAAIPVDAAVGDSERVELEKECDALAQQAALAPSHREAVQQREALQQQYDAAVLAEDFGLEGKLGRQLDAITQAPLPLPAEVYLNLADRHAALVEKVTRLCRALREVRDFTGMESLGVKLAMLKALDLSAPPRVGCNDPVSTPLSDEDQCAKDWEEAGFNDPMYVPTASSATIIAGTAASETQIKQKQQEW